MRILFIAFTYIVYHLPIYSQYDIKIKTTDSVAIHFKFARNEIIDLKEIQNRVDSMKFNETSKIEIKSYTDTAGRIPYNELLSKKRLQRVLELMPKDIDTLKIVPTSFAEQRPYFTKLNDTLFRRVDILLKEEVLDIQFNKPYPLKVFFDGNQFYLRAESLPHLDELVNTLNQFPSLQIELHGHTSGRTNPDQTLSENRTKSVKRYLVQNGIDPARIKCYGFSNTRPLIFEHPGENHPENRRVEVVFIE